MKFEAYITNLGKYNEGELVGEWVEFPVSDEEIEEVFERIGIDGEEYEEYFVTDYEVEDGFDIATLLGEYVSIDTLNEVAEAFDNVDDEKLALAVVEVNVPRSADELVELLENLDDYYLITFDEAGGHNDSDLAWYYIDSIIGSIESLDRETLERYFDYERFGRDLEYDYSATSYGWLSNY